MADCELLDRCLFFNNVKDMPQHAELFKELYCRGNNVICARYMIHRKLGEEAVPTDLFPNYVSRANKILAAAGKSSKKR